MSHVSTIFIPAQFPFGKATKIKFGLRGLVTTIFIRFVFLLPRIFTGSTAIHGSQNYYPSPLDIELIKGRGFFEEPYHDTTLLMLLQHYYPLPAVQDF